MRAVVATAGLVLAGRAGILAVIGILAFVPRAAAWETFEITVVKRPGIAAYQEVTEAFAEGCRVRAHITNLENLVDAPLHFRSNDVVLAVGQQALDAVARTPARIVSALALTVPARVIAADVLPPPERVLGALKAARPSVLRVGVLYGPHTEGMVARMAEPARALGFTLVLARASDGPGAVRALRRIASSVDALYLAPDLDLLAPQLFQYALGLEIRENLPLVAVTRQQVRSGALLAVDADPRVVGRHAAALVNELLAGVPEKRLLGTAQAGTLEVVVNRQTARRLGVDVAALRALGARFE